MQEMVAYLKRLGRQRGSAPEPNPDFWTVTFAIHLPDDFPGEIPYPNHFIGDQLYHQGLSSQEFGFVAGMEYAPAPHHSQGWQWRYKLYLDKQSPSSAWTRWDLAWEEDLVSANSDFETAQATSDAEDTA
jgi:hypothetical protein